MSGWAQMRERLRSGGLFLFDSCVAAIETIPALQHDPDNAEDLLKGPTDHAADAIRYLCMARPWAGSTEAEYQRQADIRNRMPPEPKEFTLIAGADGIVRSNYTIWHAVNCSMRRKGVKPSGYRAP